MLSIVCRKYVYVIIGISIMLLYIDNLYFFSVLGKNLSNFYMLQYLNEDNVENYDALVTFYQARGLNFSDFKYILQWTPADYAPFDFLGQRRSAFKKNKCPYTNCYVTDERNFFKDQTYFDAVLFNVRNIDNFYKYTLPTERSVEQKYIFVAMESPHNYPLCNFMFENYFNWTWTYKLDSDFRWGYITIYDLNGTVVGPKVDMEWPTYMKPINGELRDKLKSKTKAAAWFVSNCHTFSQREMFALDLEQELKEFGVSLDVYGYCGISNCKRFDTACYNKLSSDYYFYLSFENSFAEDYVTEKLLTALNNFAVPVVYGTANYKRFLPPGSYLDARELGVKQLAITMVEIMINKTRYEDFHRWRNHFKYKETSDNDDVCSLCTIMNDDKKVNEISVRKDFRMWWNGNMTQCIKSNGFY